MRKFSKGTYIFVGIAVVATVVVAGSVYAWSLSRLNKPEAAYWHALQTAMDTPGLTCTMEKSEDGMSTRQTVSLDLLSKSNLRAQTTLEKAGSKVSTETVTTKTDEYVRYTAISPPSGGSKDFSKVLGVWGKQSRADVDKVPLYDKMALGGCIVPLADLPHDQLQKQLGILRKNVIFKTDFTQAKFHRNLMSPTLEYAVTIPPNLYVIIMQDFGKSLGLNGLDELDSTPYMKKDAKPAKLTFMVDARSQRLTTIKLPGQKTTFSFSAYGTLPDTAAPKTSVSAAELQKRLKAVQ